MLSRGNDVFASSVSVGAGQMTELREFPQTVALAISEKEKTMFKETGLPSTRESFQRLLREAAETGR